MKRFFQLFLCSALTAGAFAAPLNSTSKTVIPSDVQQLIVVDYRSLQNSSTAMALKAKVLPESLKQFESALSGAGINPETDVEQLAFASFRTPDGLRIVGVAQGQFAGSKLTTRLKKQKVKGTAYRSFTIYPMSGGVSMALVDDSTLVFGEMGSVKKALDVRDGDGRSITYNTAFTDMISGVESETVWSVLDNTGTQVMLKSALGDASELADYETVKKRLNGSAYKLNFDKGFDFDLDVVTSDSFTAATLSSLLKAGVMFRKASATDAEKLALESVKVDSNSRKLQVKFAADNSKFQTLLNSQLFAAVSK